MSCDQLTTVRRPTLPGRFIQSDILDEYGLTQDQLAKRLGVSRLTVNELVRGRRAITANMALRLARLTGQDPDFWLSLQKIVDLWDAMNGDDRENILAVEPLEVGEVSDRESASSRMT